MCIRVHATRNGNWTGQGSDTSTCLDDSLPAWYGVASCMCVCTGAAWACDREGEGEHSLNLGLAAAAAVVVAVAVGTCAAAADSRVEAAAAAAGDTSAKRPPVACHSTAGVVSFV